MQKAALMISRKNRDRPGGHQCNPYVEFWKKLDRKQARREQTQITAEAVREFYYDSWSDMHGFYEDIYGNDPRYSDPMNCISEYDGADDWDDYREEFGDQEPIDYYVDLDPYCDWNTYDWDYGSEREMVTLSQEKYNLLKIKADLWEMYIQGKMPN